jgi:uncharacterized protein YgiM (DUF1202 family)
MYKLLWTGALLAGILFAISIPASGDPDSAVVTLAEARLIDQLKEMATAPERTNVPITEASVVLTAPRPTLATGTQLVADISSGSERLIVTSEALNVREGPSARANVLGRLLQGESVEVAGREGDWVQVATSNGVTGWASADYLAAQ